MTGPVPPAPEPACEAVPLPGHGHDGQVRAYARICPDGHLRHGSACDACAGNRAVTCAECGGKAPALLIPVRTWRQLIGEYVAERENRLTAEGAGPLLDQACRDEECGLCPGAPCEHGCHANAKENAGG